MGAKISTRKSVDAKQSILKKTLEVIGGKWRLYIIFQLGTEVRRYGELRRMIPQVSEKVLIQELKALINLGVIEKRALKETPPRVEYELTVKGRQILPILTKLTTVGEVLMKP
ncbi:helix-turn-helix domain-containing protein [Spirosoma sp. KNUC1025]|uniref:winged helix-turn-helix transcriptional regulator n=1 Tax=Spirosoma sp. KNUC1025 TaxID=2894082 RepID=UPI003868C8A1|nr:helix-turn-helix transcriptional regulator [Spirosoma sp. KNUC1025]